jgi:hypothetical protein
MLLRDPSAGRTGTPKPVRQGIKKKIKNGGTCACENGNVLIMDCEDKRAVPILSTYDTTMNKNGHNSKGGNRKKFHGLCVLDDKNHMST